jgi:hypothetical protein
LEDQDPSARAIAHLDRRRVQVQRPQVDQVSQLLAGPLITAVVSLFGLIIYLVAMVAYSPLLTLVGVAAAPAYGEISIDNGVTNQVSNVAPNTYDIITAWNTAQGANGQPGERLGLDVLR